MALQCHANTDLSGIRQSRQRLAAGLDLITRPVRQDLTPPRISPRSPAQPTPLIPARRGDLIYPELAGVVDLAHPPLD